MAERAALGFLFVGRETAAGRQRPVQNCWPSPACGSGSLRPLTDQYRRDMVALAVGRGLRLTRMYGPAVRCKRVSSIWRMWGLASMYPASNWSYLLRAILDISAHAVLLADRPRLGHSGHQGSHATEDRSSISSHPLADLGR